MPVKEECGVAAIYLKDYDKKHLVPEFLYSMLFTMQPRGQLSAGVSTFNPFNTGSEKRLKILKEPGRVNDLFKISDHEEYTKRVEYLKGIAGIGHVRYLTSGKGKGKIEIADEAQPFLRDHGRPWKRFSIAYNGNIANYESLREAILGDGYILDTNVDTEIIMHHISLSLKKLSKAANEQKPELSSVVEEVMGQLDGSYSVVSLFADGNLLVFRDPLEMKPLVWGENKDFYAVASESTALEKIGISKFYPVQGGSCIIFNQQGRLEKQIKKSDKKARCHFEWVYFSRASSVIDGVSVNGARERLGNNLAIADPLVPKINSNPREYVVVPVPNTAVAAAEAYAQRLGVRFSLAITKTEGQRGFINKEEERELIMNREYNIISERVKDKRVILFEDSIVRGETAKKIVAMVRNAGATEVHLRSTDCPIRHPCCYGIDMSKYKELIANRFPENTEDNIATYLDADSVVYQTQKGLVDAIGFPEDEICLACLNGNYPTPAGVEFGKKRMKEDKF